MIEKSITFAIQYQLLMMLPAWVALTLIFGMLSEYGNGWDLSAIIFIPSFLIWSVWYLFRAGVDLWRGRWRRVALYLAAYAVTLPVMEGVLQLGATASNYLHLYVMYPDYLAQIRAHASKPAKLTFYWGTSGMVGSTETDRYLFYDPTDDMAKDVGTIPTLNDNGSPDGGWVTITHLTSHFYLQVVGDE